MQWGNTPIPGTPGFTSDEEEEDACGSGRVQLQQQHSSPSAHTQQVGGGGQSSAAAGGSGQLAANGVQQQQQQQQLEEAHASPGPQHGRQQRAAGSGSPLRGATALLDPCLPAQEALAVRQALHAAGASACAAAHLSAPVTCVVCPAERAASWLPRCVDVYSAQWVLR